MTVVIFGAAASFFVCVLAIVALRPVAVVDTLARSVTIEMDLRLEAAALSEMAEATAGDSGLINNRLANPAARRCRASPRGTSPAHLRPTPG